MAKVGITGVGGGSRGATPAEARCGTGRTCPIMTRIAHAQVPQGIQRRYLRPTQGDAELDDLHVRAALEGASRR